jgi:hypothetical protein
MAILDELKKKFDQVGIEYSLVDDRIEMRLGDRLRKNMEGNDYEKLTGILTTDSIVSFWEMSDEEHPNYIYCRLTTDLDGSGMDLSMLDLVSETGYGQYDVVEGKVVVNFWINGQLFVDRFDSIFDTFVKGMCRELCRQKPGLNLAEGAALISLG